MPEAADRQSARRPRRWRTGIATLIALLGLTAVAAAGWHYREPLLQYYHLGTIPKLRVVEATLFEESPFLEVSLEHSASVPLHFYGYFQDPGCELLAKEEGAWQVLNPITCGTGMEYQQLPPHSPIRFSVMWEYVDDLEDESSPLRLCVTLWRDDEDAAVDIVLPLDRAEIEELIAKAK